MGKYGIVLYLHVFKFGTCVLRLIADRDLAKVTGQEMAKEVVIKVLV